MERRIKKLWISSSLILLLIVGVFSTAYSAPPVVDEWEIPLMSVLTGPVAFAGLPAVWGAKFAARQINEEGGIRGIPVKIVQYDTAFNPVNAISQMSRLVDDSLYIMGPFDGPGATAAGPIAAESEVPFFSAMSRPAIRAKCQPWGISNMQDSAEGSVVAVREWIKLNPDIKSVAAFYMPADPAQAEEYNLMKEQLIKMGIQVKGPIEIQTGQLDMGSTAVRALNLKADGYFAIMRTHEYVKLATELHNRGMTDGRRLITTFAAFSGQLFKIGEGMIENTYIWNKINANHQGKSWQTLVKAYKADHKGQAPVISTVTFHYDIIYALKNAFETLKITGDPDKRKEEQRKIAEYLFNSPMQKGTIADFRWKNGKMLAPYHLFQIRNNKAVFVKQLD